MSSESTQPQFSDMKHTIYYDEIVSNMPSYMRIEKQKRE